jgi:phosphoglycerate dehydrogenase-like enzyme
MRVAYTDPPWALDSRGHVDRSLARLEENILGADVELGLGVVDAGRFVTSGKLLNEYVAGADALVVYRCRVTAEVLDAAGEPCKVVARQGVGLDNIDCGLLRERGVYGFHVPDYCVAEVSTHAVALLLALERNVCVQDRLVRQDRWSIHAGGVPRRTEGLTAGIVGYGRIGRATSRKLQAFYGRILAHDPYVTSDLMAGYGVERRDTLEELLAESDVVLLHAALTAETRGLIDADALERVKPGALLVNTARGALVDVAAVHAALADGHLAGFASDVFSPEDPNRSPHARRLLERDDVVVSAHRAFLSRESEASQRRRVAEGIARVLREGVPPTHGRVA